MLLLSSLFVVFHTHVVLDADGESLGVKGNKFIKNEAAPRKAKVEVVFDIPLPQWWLQAHSSRLSSEEHPKPQREISHDIVDKSLEHVAAAVAAAAAAAAAGAAAEPVARMAPPPKAEPPVERMIAPPAVAAHTRTQAEQDAQDENCPHIEELRYWQQPTERDLKWHNPYLSKGVHSKYVTFEPDVGGWNNIRMQMEIVLVFAFATGRTLVLPPDQPMYLLNKGKGHQKHHNFRDFFPFDRISTRVPVISMEEFMAREGVTGRLRRNSDNQVYLPPGNKTSFDGTNREDRNLMWEYLRNVTACPPWKGMYDYVIIPPFPGFNSTKSPYAQQYNKRAVVFAGDPKFGQKRVANWYDLYWHQQHVVHFISKPGLGFRLLEHFYTFLHFEDPFMDRFFKRFVRDYVHYLPTIFCKGAVIIHLLRQEAAELAGQSQGKGQYSSFHVRRGELQYKEVKVNASTLIATVKDVLPPKELLFIASDENGKGYFDAIKDQGFAIRRLDNFLDVPGLGLRSLNPNYLGMLDQVICSGGRVFVGTWYSTFSGYITRMRGYLGWPDNSTWYGDVSHKRRFQKYELPRFPWYMREFPISWRGIDKP